MESHKSYLNRASFLRIWHELGNGLEYSLHHTSILDNDRAQTSLIAVRVVSTGGPRDSARLLIESSSHYVTFQDFVSLYNLSQRPVIAALPSMPLADLLLEDGENMSCHEIRIALLDVQPVLVVDQGLPICGMPLHPTYHSLLNNRWTLRWGSKWNLQAVEDEKLQYDDRLRSYLADTATIMPWKNRRFIEICGYGLYRLLSMKWLLACYFWLPIFLRLRKFRVVSEQT